MQQAAIKGSKAAIFSLAFLAVIREGIELALFLTAASIDTTASEVLIGAALGLASVAILSILPCPAPCSALVLGLILSNQWL